jgi:formate dehydrogenase iron-sulfur subunit
MIRIFISRDSASVSVGSVRIARLVCEEAAVRGLILETALTGSRGLFWLEPLVEVETPG